ncbi:hypothetical protein ACLB2K_003872 [Fragaria x ananassa]
MKAALLSTAIPWQPPPHLKPLKPAGAPLCCSNVSGASSSSSQIKLQAGEDAEVPRSPIQPEGAKETDIWRLFREAQKNILHLNQHRLKAVEDLNKANSEKQLLVDKIEQLELEKQASVAKPRGTFPYDSSDAFSSIQIDVSVFIDLVRPVCLPAF